MISTELKMRIKNAVRNYNNCEENGFTIFELEDAAEELRDCLNAVLKNNMKTNLYYRCVSHLKNQDEVEEEISSIYAESEKYGQRIESIVVIPQCTDPKYPTLPTNYMISYIYAEEV